MPTQVYTVIGVRGQLEQGRVCWRGRKRTAKRSGDQSAHSNHQIALRTIRELPAWFSATKCKANFWTHKLGGSCPFSCAGLVNPAGRRWVCESKKRATHKRADAIKLWRLHHKGARVEPGGRARALASRTAVRGRSMLRMLSRIPGMQSCRRMSTVGSFVLAAAICS